MGVVRLPELQGQYQSLKNEIQSMQYKKQKLERDSQAIQLRIAELTEVENMHYQNIRNLGDKLYTLQNEIHQLEQFVSRFENGNGKYLKIRGIAEQIVNGFFAEQGPLLTSAIIAVVQALRVNPDKYTIIFDNSEYDNTNNMI